MDRRKFLKDVGIGAAGALLVACAGKTNEDNAAESGKHHKKGPMTMRQNHNTGDTVSILGYGCMRLPVIQGETEEEDAGIDQEEVNRQVDYALANGVNYFDTSPAYCKGRSETAMGKALSRHPRESYYLATKMSNFAPSTWSHDASVEIFENSLKYLQTDYIDYMLLHAIGGFSDELDSTQTFEERYINNGILDFLEQKKREGVIRNLGFSYHGDVAIFDRLLREMDEGKHHWDFVQIQMNYVDWKHAKEINPRNTNAEYLYEELAKRNIPVVIMEPLLGGRLAEVPTAVAAQMKQRRPDDSTAAWAFRYAGTKPQILTVLSGMTYMEHLKDNINTYSSLDPITPEEDEFLMRIGTDIAFNEQIPCTGCAYCMPCPFGLDIPGIFDHYNKCVNDDAVPHDKRHPRYAEARKQFLIGMDRAIPKSRQAGHCISCHACESHCPQGIHIPEKMHEIDIYTIKLRANKV